jgi:DNA-binding Xre family transcriptional regulator
MSKKGLLSLEKIQKLLKDMKLYNVSKATGLSFPTLKKLADGKKENHTYNTIKAVSDYLRVRK